MFPKYRPLCLASADSCPAYAFPACPAYEHRLSRGEKKDIQVEPAQRSTRSFGLRLVTWRQATVPTVAQAMDLLGNLIDVAC